MIVFENIFQRVDAIIRNHETKVKEYATSYGAFIHGLLQTMLSKDGVILALAFEQVQLTKGAKLLLFIVTVSIIGAYFSKKVLKNYSHIKGVAEDFLKAVDIRGSLKEAITDIAKDQYKKDNNQKE